MRSFLRVFDQSFFGSYIKMHKLAFFKVVNFEKIPLLEACFMSPMAELVEMTEKVVTVP